MLDQEPTVYKHEDSFWCTHPPCAGGSLWQSGPSPLPQRFLERGSRGLSHCHKKSMEDERRDLLNCSLPPATNFPPRDVPSKSLEIHLRSSSRMVQRRHICTFPLLHRYIDHFRAASTLGCLAEVKRSEARGCVGERKMSDCRLGSPSTSHFTLHDKRNNVHRSFVPNSRSDKARYNTSKDLVSGYLKDVLLGQHRRVSPHDMIDHHEPQWMSRAGHHDADINRIAVPNPLHSARLRRPFFAENGNHPITARSNTLSTKLS